MLEPRTSFGVQTGWTGKRGLSLTVYIYEDLFEVEEEMRGAVS
jgi:hypothetical protein